MFGAQVLWVNTPFRNGCLKFLFRYLRSVWEPSSSACDLIRHNRRWNRVMAHLQKHSRWMDGWMNDLLFYVLFNSISVIWGRWAGDNERLCAMEPRLRLKRSSPKVGLQFTTAWSVGQRLTRWATGSPQKHSKHWTNKGYVFAKANSPLEQKHDRHWRRITVHTQKHNRHWNREAVTSHWNKSIIVTRTDELRIRKGIFHTGSEESYTCKSIADTGTEENTFFSKAL